MRPSLSRRALLALLAVSVPVPLCGQGDGAGTTLRDQGSSRETARFLLAPVGARSVGLGGAVAAFRADAEGVFWNPASTAALQRSTVFVHATNDFGTSSQALGFLWSWRSAQFGLTYYHFDMGEIDARDAANQGLGVLSLDDEALIVTAGYSLTPRLDVGMSYKLLRLASVCPGSCESLDQQVTGHAFDFGAIAEPSGARGLRLGLVLRNLGPGARLSAGGSSDPMPTRLRLGASVSLMRAFFPAEQRFEIQLLGDVQEPVSEFDDLDGFLGAEVSLREILYLRGGYAWATEGRTGPSLGIGLRYEGLVVDVGRAFDDFAGFDTDAPFQVSLAFQF